MLPKHKAGKVAGVMMALFFLFPACTEPEMKAPPKVKPYAAYDFTLSDLSGQTVSLAGLRGNPVILNFWASWCLPCRNEMPELEKLHKEYSKSGLRLLMVNVKEPKEPVEEFIKKNGHTFTVLLDTKGEVSQDYQVFGLPSTFFIDSEGTVQYQYMGELTWGITKMGLRAILPEEDI